MLASPTQLSHQSQGFDKEIVHHYGSMCAILHENSMQPRNDHNDNVLSSARDPTVVMLLLRTARKERQDIVSKHKY
jgi:hypothetical protein